MLTRRDWDGDALKCPVCDSERLRVVDTRPHKGTTRRRRVCKACGFKFYTAEFICDRVTCRSVETGKTVK